MEWTRAHTDKESQASSTHQMLKNQIISSSSFFFSGKMKSNDSALLINEMKSALSFPCLSALHVQQAAPNSLMCAECTICNCIISFQFTAIVFVWFYHTFTTGNYLLTVLIIFIFLISKTILVITNSCKKTHYCISTSVIVMLCAWLLFKSSTCIKSFVHAHIIIILLFFKSDYYSLHLTK